MLRKPRGASIYSLTLAGEPAAILASVRPQFGSCFKQKGWRGCVQELLREGDEVAAAAATEGPSASQPEEEPSTPVPATPAARPANRRDSLTLSTMLKQQKASGVFDTAS